jgi:ribosomal protein S18 acetylase RimI-like enzyme
MDSSITIRTARPADGPAIYRLGVDQPGFEVSKNTRFYAKDYLEEWLAVPRGDILTVAEKDAEVVGFLICRVLHGSAILENIAVADDRRNAGLASALLRDLQDRLGAEGIREVHGLVRVGNPAIEFFRGAGFETGHQFTWIERRVADSSAQSDHPQAEA